MVMAATQILWAAYAIEYDHYNAYSPDLATAEFLRPFVEQRASIAFTYSDDPDGRGYRVVGILPYFDRDIFINLPEPFWSWSNRKPTEQMFTEALPTYPAVVVVEVPRVIQNSRSTCRIQKSDCCTGMDIALLRCFAARFRCALKRRRRVVI